jgi:hypothetical protein
LPERNDSPLNSFEAGMIALNSLDDNFVINNFVCEYENFKDDLKRFLLPFSKDKKIISKQDIHRFFQQQKSEKRLKLSH